MKKYFVFVLTLLFILAFVGCNIKKREPYTSFTVDCTNDEYCKNPEVDYWTGSYFEKKNMKNKSCLFRGENYSGAYHRSIVDKTNSYTTDMYVDDNYIEFGLRSDTGELVYINLANADFYDTQPYLPDVANPEETAISLATEIASGFVDNIEDYTQISEQPHTSYKEREGKTYQITYYVLKFVKKVNGYLSSDYIAVTVTSKGTPKSITVGDIGAFDGTSLTFDATAVEQSVSDKIASIYKESSLNVKETDVYQQKIVLTPDGDICMYSTMIVSGVDDTIDEEQRAGVVILTTLAKKSK